MRLEIPPELFSAVIFQLESSGSDDLARELRTIRNEALLASAQEPDRGTFVTDLIMRLLAYPRDVPVFIADELMETRPLRTVCWDKDGKSIVVLTPWLYGKRMGEDVKPRVPSTRCPMMSFSAKPAPLRCTLTEGHSGRHSFEPPESCG